MNPKGRDAKLTANPKGHGAKLNMNPRIFGMKLNVHSRGCNTNTASSHAILLQSCVICGPDLPISPYSSFTPKKVLITLVSLFTAKVGLNI